MAGIGFALRRILQHNTLSSLFRAYAYAGLLSAGPWVLPILGMILVGALASAQGAGKTAGFRFLVSGVAAPAMEVVQFQVSVTYLIPLSFILAGLLQLGITRYVADRLYERKVETVFPNLSGAILVTTLVAGVLAALALIFLFPEQSLIYRVLMFGSFVTLCDIWITTTLLSGMKAYKGILGFFALGYGLIVALTLPLRAFGLEGLLASFFTGHVVLFFGLYWLAMRHYASDRYLEFDFLAPGRMYRSLLLAGFLYNLGIWADKFVFWFHPDTSQAVIGPLRASIIYDLPMFLAYLSIVPAMAIFLLRIETNFAEYYAKFFHEVCHGGTLNRIESLRDELVHATREGLFDILKVQAIVLLVFLALGEQLLYALGISRLYLPLLTIDVVAVSLQVVFLVQLTVLFYFDERRVVLGLLAAFVLGNFLLTWLSIAFGPVFYGYGFALALLLVVIAGFYRLDRHLDNLIYETFMMQP